MLHIWNLNLLKAFGVCYELCSPLYFIDPLKKVASSKWIVYIKLL